MNTNTTKNPQYLGQVKVKTLTENAKLPFQSSKDAVGYDLYCSKSITIAHGNVGRVQTGLAFQIPPHLEMQIRPRSSFGAKGILIPNSPATIDPDYRGEVQVLILNLSGTTITLDTGDRIGQAVFTYRYQVSFLKVDELSDTERGEGGFGSTGK